MITLFTIPKPFVGHTATIQDNAIRSWRALMDCEVFLMGDEDGVSDYARQNDLRQFADVKRTVHGTPLIDDVWEQARTAGSGSLFAYLNCDIMLDRDLEAIADRIPFDTYLAIARRWDVDISDPWSLELDWPATLSDFARKCGHLHHSRAVECHMFTRDTDFGSIPPFAVGRNRYDNWLVLRALESGLPVIDLTPCLTVVHQNHARHIPALSDEEYLAEIRENHRLAGGYQHLATSYDATHVLEPSGIQENASGLAKRFYRSFRSVCSTLGV